MRTFPNLLSWRWKFLTLQLGVIFSQHGEDNLLQPIDFCSSKFFPIDINYMIHDKELLAIVDVLERVVSFIQRSST
jgi:hypothetical protein